MAFLQIYKPYSLILDQPYASITPFPVGFAEYFCTHPLLLKSFRWRTWWCGFRSWGLELRLPTLRLACEDGSTRFSVVLLLLFCNIWFVKDFMLCNIYRRLGCDINLWVVCIDYWSRDRYNDTIRFFLKGKAWQSGIRAWSDCRMTLDGQIPSYPFQKWFSKTLLISAFAFHVCLSDVMIF